MAAGICFLGMTLITGCFEEEEKPAAPDPGKPEVVIPPAEPENPKPHPDPVTPTIPDPPEPPKPEPTSIAIVDLCSNSGMADSIAEALGKDSGEQIDVESVADNHQVLVVAVDPLLSEEAAMVLGNLFADGKKLILVGSPPGDNRPPCTTLIRPDDTAVGTLAGNWIVSELARQAEQSGRASIAGNIVQIRASDEDSVSVQRYNGFIRILNRHIGAVFVHDGPGFWTKEDAKKRMEEALRIQKGIRVVYAHSDLMASGAVEAIAAHRKATPDAPEISIISVGGRSVDPESEGVDVSTSISVSPLAEKAVEVAQKIAMNAEFEPPSEIKIVLESVVSATSE